MTVDGREKIDNDGVGNKGGTNSTKEREEVKKECVVVRERPNKRFAEVNEGFLKRLIC